MKYEELSQDIIKNVGGQENINSVWHCVTRLRFNLKDETKAHTEVLKNMHGVMDVIQRGGQYQVVIGPHVEDVYDTLIQVGHLESKTKEQTNVTQTDLDPESEKGIINNFLDMLMGIFQPVLGILAASGMIKAVMSLLTVTKVLETTDGTYIILSATGDALFYFFPVVLGWSAAKRFKVKEVIGITLGGILVYPTLIAATSGKVLYTLFKGTLFEQPVYMTFLKIPVILQNYSTTVIPIILIVFVASKVERYLHKTLPAILRSFFVPFFTVLITAPIALIVIGPVAIMLQDVIGAIVNGLISLDPGIAGLVLGSVWSILVIFGLHWGVIPMFALNVSNYGYDVVNPLIFAGALASMGACLGVILTSKVAKEKSIAIPAMISSFFGVNEPTLYGVLMPRKKLMIATFLASGVGGGIAGFTGSKLYAFGASGPLGLPCFINPNGIDSGFIGLIVGGVVAFVLAFGAGVVLANKKETLVIGKKSTVKA
jgi:PTS system beta-glucosides-specific IIC component